MKDLNALARDLNAEGKEKLLKEIEQKAQEEAREIIRQAEAQAEQKKKAAQAKGERRKKEAEERVEERVAQLKKHNQASIGVKKKQVRLRQNEKIIERVLNKVEEEIEKRLDGGNYPRVLRDWIVEAVLGIDADRVIISVSSKERPLITEEFLKEVEKRAGDLRGSSVTVTLSEEDERDYGVRVLSEDGRTEYRNQVETRLNRSRAAYRKLIFQKLGIEARE